MKTRALNRVIVCSILISVASAAAATPLARVVSTGGNLQFIPQAAAEEYTLTVAGGPGNGRWRATFSAGQPIDLERATGEAALADGQYTWELRAASRPAAGHAAAAGEAADGRGAARRAARELPAQWGAFRVVNGAITAGADAEPTARPAVEAGADQPQRDQVIPDDLIVQGSGCFGFDCVNNEVFGFNTVVLKENNLRLFFDDTSAGAGFPANDWQLTANDSASGGVSRFSIEDISGATVPFTIRAGAPSNSLFVDTTGRVGLRTTTPVLDLHAATSNTPAHRLEQTNAGGFNAQTWDIAGNEANFFVRDVTGGSLLPFRIRPGAPTSSLDIAATGNVGIGTASATAKLDVVGDPAQALIRTATGASAAGRILLRLRNNGKTRLAFENTDIGTVWTADNSGNAFTINHVDSVADANEFRLDTEGTLTLAGTLRVNGGANTFPDYVFDADYPLLPLGELRTFVASRKHLPNVPSAADIAAAGGMIDLTDLQLRLLEKVEELTLYVLQQQAVIEHQGAQLDALRAALAAPQP